MFFFFFSFFFFMAVFAIESAEFRTVSDLFSLVCFVDLRFDLKVSRFHGFIELFAPRG